MLNLCLCIPLMTSAVNGLDSSMVNGTLFIWLEEYNLRFHHLRSSNHPRLAGIFQASDRDRLGYFLIQDFPRIKADRRNHHRIN